MTLKKAIFDFKYFDLSSLRFSSYYGWSTCIIMNNLWFANPVSHKEFSLAKKDIMEYYYGH